MLRSGRDLYFVQTVSDGTIKEGWVPGSWLVEQGVSRSELDRRPRWGNSTESLDRASSEASEPELKNLARFAATLEKAKTKEGTCIVKLFPKKVICDFFFFFFFFFFFYRTSETFFIFNI